MSEGDPKSKELESFRESMKEGVKTFLNFAAEFGDPPVPPNPFDFGIGDNRIVDDLSPGEVEILRKIVFEELGVVDGDPDIVHRRYVSKGSPETPSPGDIKVIVFRTNRETDGVFLQELTFPDGQKRLVVGIDKNI